MSGLIKKISRFLKGERGTLAPIAAVALTAMIGLTGSAVDLGVIYTAKTELQNAADAAALAAAARLIAYDDNGDAVATPDDAWDEAVYYVGRNKVVGDGDPPGGILLESDFTIGYWDSSINDFDPDRIGPSSNPDDLTAARVTVRRDTVANSPVPTFFSRIFGIDQVSLSATSTALLGYAGGTEPGGVTLPITVKASAVADADGPICGTSLTFHSEPDENAEWTSFFSWPPSNPKIKKYVNGTYESPELNVGDIVYTTNGTLSNNVFNDLYTRFQAEGTDTDSDGYADYWEVLLPVVEPTYCPRSKEVVGFMTMVITDVRPAPHKDIVGYLKCDKVLVGSVSGGENFGTRATRPTVVQ